MTLDIEISTPPLGYEVHFDNKEQRFEMFDEVELKKPEMMECSLVIPAYNEESRIMPFLEDISKNLPEKWEIIVVCDGTDRTAEIALSFGDRFTVLEYGHKLGKGGAILEGFYRAKGDIVGYVDADGALGSSDIIKVFSKVDEQNPVAIASRWVKGSNIIEKQTFLRIFLGRVYHYTTFAILGLRQKDTQCGLKAFHKIVNEEVVKRLKLTNLSIDTAFLYHCKLLSFRVAEVPVSWRDVEGSKVRPLKTALVMFATLIGIKMAHSRNAERTRSVISEMYELLQNFRS